MATDGIEIGLKQLRSLEQALAELRDRNQRAPSRTLARMIAQLEAEIADRARKPTKRATPRCLGQELRAPGPGSGQWLAAARRSLKPVRLPPGRARLATRPTPTGSLMPVKTIGIIEVAFFTAERRLRS